MMSDGISATLMGHPVIASPDAKVPLKIGIDFEKIPTTPEAWIEVAIVAIREIRNAGYEPIKLADVVFPDEGEGRYPLELHFEGEAGKT